MWALPIIGGVVVSKKEEKKTDKQIKENKDVEKVSETKVKKAEDTVVIFKCKKPLTKTQYQALAERVREENQRSGVKVVIAPCIVDGVEVKQK